MLQYLTGPASREQMNEEIVHILVKIQIFFLRHELVLKSIEDRVITSENDRLMQYQNIKTTIKADAAEIL